MRCDERVTEGTEIILVLGGFPGAKGTGVVAMPRQEGLANGRFELEHSIISRNKINHRQNILISIKHACHS